MTRRQVEMRHGSRVRVEYVDLGDPAGQGEYVDVLKRIEEQRLPYPIVAVDGMLRLAGSAHYSHVMPLVEEALASRRERDGSRKES